MWTQKEASLLEELKQQEHLCVEKYGRYAQQAQDPELKQLFTTIQNKEQQHEQTVTQMIGGQVPQMAQNQQAQQQNQQQAQQQNQQQAQQGTPAPGVQQNPAWQADAYLCRDALGTEKHVSSVYDMAVFEFAQPQARQVLNHLQKEEQEHGEMIYAYMARNGMYQAQ